MRKMVNIRMPEEIKRFFKKWAFLERRSMTNFIINAVLSYIKATYSEEMSEAKPEKPNAKLKT